MVRHFSLLSNLTLRPGSANQGNSYFLSQPSALLSPLIEFLKSSSAHIRPVAISLEDSSSYISGFYFINSHHGHYTPISTNNFSWPFLAQTSRPFLVWGRHHATRGIFPDQESNLGPLPWGVWNLDHWTTWAVRSLLLSERIITISLTVLLIIFPFPCVSPFSGLIIANWSSPLTKPPISVSTTQN